MKCYECDCCHEVTLVRWSPDDHAFIKTKANQCWGVKEPFIIDNIGAECSVYEHKIKKEIGAQDAIAHYKHGITHDIFSEPVTTYAKLSIEALDKQIPKKPIHIHEEHSEHLWRRDKNGEIDLWAFESGYCNGPVCTRCWHSECEHCNEDWETDHTEPCVIDKDICPVCGSVLGKPQYCHECGQALDWS